MKGGVDVHNAIIKRLLCVALTVVFLFVAGCDEGQHTYKYNDNPKVKKIGSGIVTSNENYSLLWDESRACIMLKDIATGKIWSTVPYDYYTENSDQSFQDIICASPLFVKYLTQPDNSIKTLYGSSIFEKGAYSARLVKNGIEVTYYFHTIEASIPVIYRLKENFIEVEINTKDIKEGAYPIYQIAVSPFLSSVKNGNEKGWLFVPSGSGAVMKTSDIDNRKQYEEPVYGEDASVNVSVKSANNAHIKLPFFGASSGNDFMVGIIDSGAECCNIAAQTGDMGMRYSSTYPVFSIRGYNLLEVNMVYAGATQKSAFYRDELIDQTLRVCYYPSTKQNAETVDMANIYRNYLQKKGYLKEKIKNSPLYLQIIGGMYVDKLFAGFSYKSFESATTFEQAEEIIENAKERLNVTPTVQLKGFGTSGMDIDKLGGGFKTASDLGNIKDINNFKNHNNIFFDFDIFRYRNGRNKAAKTANSETAYQYDYDIMTGSKIESRGRYKLVSRAQLGNVGKKLEKTLDKYQLNNVSLSSAGHLSYSDYCNVKYQQKGNMAKDITNLLSGLKKDIMTENSNAYAAVQSEHILESPVSSSKMVTFDYDVPMYQMVFKGYVSMSAMGDEFQILDAVEMGIGLKYTVCDHFNPDFIDNPFDGAAYGVYRDVQEDITKDYESVKECLKATENAVIIGYSVLENGLTKTTFDNSITVYVNRSNNECECEFGTVLPMGYLYG